MNQPARPSRVSSTNSIDAVESSQEETDFWDSPSWDIRSSFDSVTEAFSFALKSIWVFYYLEITYDLSIINFFGRLAGFLGNKARIAIRQRRKLFLVLGDITNALNASLNLRQILFGVNQTRKLNYYTRSGESRFIEIWNMIHFIVIIMKWLLIFWVRMNCNAFGECFQCQSD